MRKRRKPATVRPAYHPSILPAGREGGTLVLRDGSRLELSRALPEDAGRIQAFLRRLPSDDCERVWRSLRVGADEMQEFLGQLSECEHGGAFVVHGGNDQVEAFAAYRLLSGLRDTASITLAVDPERRGMGVATLLLEHLTVLAARQGVTRLVGVSQADNRQLIELFKASGFAPDVREDERSVSFLISTRPNEAQVLTQRRASERSFTAASLRPLFAPGSVAVIGASRRTSSLGHRMVASLLRHGFNGPVYPVNPNTDHVHSIQAYPEMAAIGRPVDLAVVALPAPAIAAAVDDCARAGVRVLVVISAGFSETGEDGSRREQELLEQVRSRGMRLLGPNSMGVIHTDPEVRLNASYSPQMPEPGTAALCSHSGALGMAIVALARRRGLGISSFVAVGNRADISGNDVLEYWEEDHRTRVIMFYLESFGNPRHFARLARRVGRSKPIVVVRAGRTQAARRAAGTRDRAVATATIAADALFRQTGAIRADTLEEMFGITRILTDQPLLSGRRVAVLTNAGGPAILCTDALVGSGMRVEPLAGSTLAALQRLLPAEANLANPIDMLPSCDPTTYSRAVELILNASEVDALVVIFTPMGVIATHEYCRAICAGVEAARSGGRATSKPVLASIIAAEEELRSLETGGGERIPIYPFPEVVGRLLSKIADYSEWRAVDPGIFPEYPDQRLDEVRALCDDVLAGRGPCWLAAPEIRTVLEAGGLTVSGGGVVASGDEAVAMAEQLGYPVAVQLATFDIADRSERWAVHLDLEGPDAVAAAVAELEHRYQDANAAGRVEGVVVRPMHHGAAEVIIRATDDRRFGPLISFSLGGVERELLGDQAHRVSPLTDLDARTMVRQIRGYPLLRGHRGLPPAHVSALEEALLRVSRLLEAVPLITELELNPVFALQEDQGYRISGASVRLGPKE